jgi:hypothetical protein
MPLYFKMLRIRERARTSYLSIVRFTFESIEEFGSASIWITLNSSAKVTKGLKYS